MPLIRISKILLIIFFFIFFNSKIFSQHGYEKNFYGGIFYISDYIASDDFQKLKSFNSDPELVDSIYSKALQFFDGDYSETFLCLAFGTVPFNDIKVKLPIIGSQIIIPLPSPSKMKFENRTKNLPKNIFVDSPKNDFGDKDKIAHFFGNAFLSYNFGWFNFSKFMGIFVEKVEDGFFVEGGFDTRDLIVNTLGELFGKLVKNNPGVKPSNVLKFYQLIYFRI